ncbi:MAG: hypothetical protein ACK4NR_08365 [Micavibrio sp.]
MTESPANLCGIFNRVAPSHFKGAVKRSLRASSYHSENITLQQSYRNNECWLSPSSKSGFAVTPDHELISVFSCVNGDGRKMMNFIKSKYDHLHLNCFNTTFLRSFYEKHGFKIIRKEANWQAGGPDILFMEYKKP